MVSPARTARVRVALHARDELGEGPFWDERTGELLRVDITGGRIHAWNPVTHRVATHEVAGEVSAVLPRVGTSGWLLAIGNRLLLQDGEAQRTLAAVEERRPGNRFNDCKCDPRGRVWAGTMSRQRAPGTAALYRLAPGGAIERVIAGTTISNGLGWSPAGDRMYFIDSTTQRIDVFDFDAVGGEVADRRTLVEVDRRDGLPDGMTVDAEGGIWVCLFGGGAVRRYSPDGVLEAAIALPVTNPTSPVFGGADLRTLYVTSARHRLSPERLGVEPLAGAVLALYPGVRGLPGNRFAG